MNSSSAYVPEKGDIVWIDFDPAEGHEQRWRRPALVISPFEYHRKTGLCLVCPITSKIKGYPFEVEIPEGVWIRGVVLSDFVRSVDFAWRRAEFAAKMPEIARARVIWFLGMLIK